MSEMVYFDQNDKDWTFTTPLKSTVMNDSDIGTISRYHFHRKKVVFFNLRIFFVKLAAKEIITREH